MPDPEQFIKKLRAAMERAQQEQDMLSLSVPSPIRDRFFDAIVKILLDEDDKHDANHCQICMPAALNLALNALGWEDRNAPRPALPQERMNALLQQVTIALQFLDKLHKQGLYDDL